MACPVAQQQGGTKPALVDIASESTIVAARIAARIIFLNINLTSSRPRPRKVRTKSAEGSSAWVSKPRAGRPRRPDYGHDPRGNRRELDAADDR